MFRWLRERRQRRQEEARERRAQLRDKVQTGGIAGARKHLSYYTEGKEAPRGAADEGIAQQFAMQLIAQELANDADNDGHRQHVSQVHHGSGDNIAGSVSHSHHAHSGHDSPGSYDPGSSPSSDSPGSDSSW